MKRDTPEHPFGCWPMWPNCSNLDSDTDSAVCVGFFLGFYSSFLAFFFSECKRVGASLDFDETREATGKKRKDEWQI